MVGRILVKADITAELKGSSDSFKAKAVRSKAELELLEFRVRN